MAETIRVFFGLLEIIIRKIALCNKKILMRKDGIPHVIVSISRQNQGFQYFF